MEGGRAALRGDSAASLRPEMSSYFLSVCFLCLLSPGIWHLALWDRSNFRGKLNSECFQFSLVQWWSMPFARATQCGTI